jgi:colanic acid biosynthesis glycosyl transferase WcaI
VRGLRDASLRAAVANVVLGERMADRLRARGVSTGNVKVIPNWADGNAITPLPMKANPLRAEWSLSDKFVVMYSGNMGRAHVLAPVVGAAEVLRDQASLVFLLVGDGAGRARLEREVAAKGLRNVFFRPHKPQEQLRFSLTLADVHLVSLKPELEGLILPSKAYGVFAAGRPMIFMGAADGEIGRLLVEAHCGEVVPSGDSDALVSSILGMMNARDRGEAMGQSARAVRTAFFEDRRDGRVGGSVGGGGEGQVIGAQCSVREGQGRVKASAKEQCSVLSARCEVRNAQEQGRGTRGGGRVKASE